jgi:formamidopyrimidine-DNA glycosylase
MPELPEVENVRSGLLPLLGSEFEITWFSNYPKYSSIAAASGRLESLERRGKWLIFTLSKEPGFLLDLVVHLGMTGRLTLAAEKPEGDHLHALWHLQAPDGSQSWLAFFDPRRFGKLACVPHKKYASLPGLHTLGPEATDPSSSTTKLLALRGSSRSIKSALLDQSVLAGVGNIYCDESLFAAKIHPATPCSKISEQQYRSLAAALADLLSASIREGGTTFRDYRRPDGSSGSNAELLRCYGRSSLPCLVCGTLLRSTTVAGRSTVFCASCQAHPDES